MMSLHKDVKVKRGQKEERNFHSLKIRKPKRIMEKIKNKK
jgi:hypothetical protein